MNEYNVSDYGIFTNGISTVQKLNTSVESGKGKIEEAKAILSNGSVYMGPAADEAVNACGQAASKMSTVMTNMNTISDYLKTTSGNYQTGDQAATDTVQSATDTSSTSTSKASDSKMSVPSDPAIAEKKRQFLGDVDDPTQYTEYQGKDLYGRYNTMQMFDNTTGEVLKNLDSITMKPGETRVITVKLPTDTGMINQITRTTADGNGAYRSGKIVTARSDIDPDPNNVDYVRLVEGKNGSYHAPANTEWLHNNSYDWILTANEEGKVTASQTCLWSSSMTKGRNLKAMVKLVVNVKNNA